MPLVQLHEAPLDLGLAAARRLAPRRDATLGLVGLPRREARAALAGGPQGRWRAARWADIRVVYTNKPRGHERGRSSPGDGAVLPSS